MPFASPISLYNTLTRRVEPVATREQGHLRMYVCGVTVYDLAHVGHARVYVLFDVVARFLESEGTRVTYARNFTDVDDRIIDRANATGRSAADLGAEMCDAFSADVTALGCRKPDVEPRATLHVPEMIALIEELERAGIAYRAHGDVYFDVTRFPAYGKLSNRKLEDLQAGARIEVDEQKRNPGDFALWKAAKPGEPVWESPFGPGRPGWHIECSAMSARYLGQPFDLHGGGEDLIFPHHENEIAQSEAASGVPLATHWTHVSFLRRGADKMSKSLGNFVTIRQALEQHPADAVRLYLLQTHYRSPLEFAEDGIAEAQTGILRMYETLQRADASGGPVTEGREAATCRSELRQALADDLNTPRAVAALHDAVRAVNRLADAGKNAESRGAARALRESAALLGILQRDPAEALAADRAVRASAAGLSDAHIEGLLEERRAARKSRDFKRADEIRKQLADAGIDLKDNPDGTTTWGASR
jgi:cysteinyl-tRNA synthetase